MGGLIVLYYSMCLEFFQDLLLSPFHYTLTLKNNQNVCEIFIFIFYNLYSVTPLEDWQPDLCFRIVRAFLIEEQKIVVRVLKAQEASKK